MTHDSARHTDDSPSLTPERLAEIRAITPDVGLSGEGEVRITVGERDALVGLAEQLEETVGMLVDERVQHAETLVQHAMALAVLEKRAAEYEERIPVLEGRLAPPAKTTLTTEIQAPRPRQGSKVDGHDATFWHKIAQENRKQIEALEGRLADYEHTIRSLSELNSLGLSELQEELEGRLAELEGNLQSAESRLSEATDTLAKRDAEVKNLTEALRDAREVLGKFEWLPFRATITRHWEPTGDPNGAWVSRAEVARDVGQSDTFTCPTCGHHEPVHEPGCSMRSVLDSKPALRLRHRREALRAEPAEEPTHG